LGLLLLRSLGVLIAFQLLAVAVVAAGVRGVAGRLTLVGLAVLAGIGIALRGFDPVAHFAGAMVAGWLVSFGARRGSGLGRVSMLATVPVLVATALTLAGSSPRQSWAELRSQVAVVAGVDSLATLAPGISPEERVVRERYQTVARSAAQWALRLLPAEIVVFGWMQVLVVVMSARRILRNAHVHVAFGRLSEWRVPFGWIWVLAAGLALVVTRQSWAVTLGFNVVVLVIAVLAMQGGAVTMAALERGSAPVARMVLLVVAAVAAWPLFVGGLAILGAADLWVDFRRLRTPASGS